MEATSSFSAPAWSDLPPELVGCVITRLPAAADCARLRAVCQSWRSAMRLHHGMPPRQPPPWLVLPAAHACFPASTHGRPVSFPEKTRCVCSTGSWLVLLSLDAGPAAHRSYYRLHNPFTGTTVPLPELGAAMDAVPETKKKTKIRKMLVRSSGPRVVVVAVMTGNPSYPIVLSRPGKGAWLYKAHRDLFTSIIDIAFLGDRLYGMTQAEELLSIDAAIYDGDDDGGGMVTDARRAVENPMMTSDDGSSNAEEAAGEDGECIDGGGVDVEEESNVDEEDDSMVLQGMDRDDYDDDDGDMVLETCHYFVDDDEDASSPPLESLGLNVINWHLVESCGKLLMVKPQLQCPKGHVEFTRKVDVFELDMSVGVGVGVWVPVVGGLGGQTLFISRSFCKSVRAGGEIEADAIYFIDRVMYLA